MPSPTANSQLALRALVVVLVDAMMRARRV
jgi:hypothetical protein